jgi:glycosyltransferase involved in cell wall biosynthesis
MVVVQAPPVFAPTVALAMVASSPRVLIVDVHSGALNDLRWKWSFPLMRWILRRSDGVITTNEQLLQGTDLDPAPVFVLHDPLQDRREAARRSPRQTRPYVVFPASGSWDEPVDAVRGAAALLEGRVDVHVTGHVQAEPGSTRVRYTGYLPRAEYEELLAGAAAILALCTEDATMQRSAYEALELGIPIVSSSTTVLQEALGDSAVYVENTPEAIVRGIEEVLEREFDLRAASGHVLVSMQEQGDRVIQELLRLGADRARSAR